MLPKAGLQWDLSHRLRGWGWVTERGARPLGSPLVTGGDVLESHSLDITESNNAPPGAVALQYEQVTSATSREGGPRSEPPPLGDSFHSYLTLLFTCRSFGQRVFL